MDPLLHLAAFDDLNKFVKSTVLSVYTCIYMTLTFASTCTNSLRKHFLTKKATSVNMMKTRSGPQRVKTRSAIPCSMMKRENRNLIMKLGQYKNLARTPPTCLPNIGKGKAATLTGLVVISMCFLMDSACNLQCCETCMWISFLSTMHVGYLTVGLFE